jgi:ubiquinone/menaquinone biosynthesis C-methylase UbiE
MPARDTKKFYADEEVRVASGHLNFALAEAGEVIYDAAAATGDYVQALLDRGKTVMGSDINAQYVAVAKKRNLPIIVADAAQLDLPDKSVDTILLFEVLEHIPNKLIRQRILKEAKRVSRKNVLITIPNSNAVDLLSRCGLTYEHMLDRDHSVFFTDKIIKADLEQVFKQVSIRPSEAIEERLFGELFDPKPLNWINRVLKYSKYQQQLFFRYYIVADSSK